jgi:hypothetical protein
VESQLQLRKFQQNLNTGQQDLEKNQQDHKSCQQELKRCQQELKSCRREFESSGADAQADIQKLESEFEVKYRRDLKAREHAFLHVQSERDKSTTKKWYQQNTSLRRERDIAKNALAEANDKLRRRDQQPQIDRDLIVHQTRNEANEDAERRLKETRDTFDNHPAVLHQIRNPGADLIGAQAVEKIKDDHRKEHASLISVLRDSERREKKLRSKIERFRAKDSRLIIENATLKGKIARSQTKRDSLKSQVFHPQVMVLNTGRGNTRPAKSPKDGNMLQSMVGHPQARMGDLEEENANLKATKGMAEAELSEDDDAGGQLQGELHQSTRRDDKADLGDKLSSLFNDNSVHDEVPSNEPGSLYDDSVEVDSVDDELPDSVAELKQKKEVVNESGANPTMPSTSASQSTEINHQGGPRQQAQPLTLAQTVAANKLKMAEEAQQEQMKMAQRPRLVPRLRRK